MSNPQNENTSLAPVKLTSRPRITGTSSVAKMLESFDLIDINDLRDTYAKDTTIKEFQQYLTICIQRNLNPFAGQVHFIVRGTNEKRKATIQISIDGLRAIAKNTGDYMGSDAPVWGPMVAADPKIYADAKDFYFPEWCSVTTYTYSHGMRVPHVFVCYWEEYVATKGEWIDKRPTGKLIITDMWSRFKRRMIAKCAEAGSIRMGNPECSGLYTHDEMMQADARDNTLNDIANGSPIVDADTTPEKANFSKEEPDKAILYIAQKIKEFLVSLSYPITPNAVKEYLKTHQLSTIKQWENFQYDVTNYNHPLLDLIIIQMGIETDGAFNNSEYDKCLEVYGVTSENVIQEIELLLENAQRFIHHVTDEIPVPVA